MNPEYDRRINLCSKAVGKAVKKLDLAWGFAEDYQGIEIRVNTQIGKGVVVVLLDTGHGPRFPKYITFSVHGYFDYDVNKKVNISGGNHGSSKVKFLPDKISTIALQKAILKAAEAVMAVCTIENMEKLKKEALEKRRQKIKEDRFNRFQTTHLYVSGSISK